eukprot:1464961-Pyramimonas_sp.AAC.1
MPQNPTKREEHRRYLQGVLYRGLEGVWRGSRGGHPHLKRRHALVLVEGVVPQEPIRGSRGVLKGSRGGHPHLKYRHALVPVEGVVPQEPISGAELRQLPARHRTPQRHLSVLVLTHVVSAVLHQPLQDLEGVQRGYGGGTEEGQGGICRSSVDAREPRNREDKVKNTRGIFKECCTSFEQGRRPRAPTPNYWCVVQYMRGTGLEGGSRGGPEGV